MNVLALTKYDRKGASSRLRFMQFKDALAERGIAVDYCPLLSDRYLDVLYQKGRMPVSSVASGILRRLRDTFKMRNYEVIWIEGELFPWLPAALEQLLLDKTKRLIIDFDDPIYLRYKGKKLLQLPSISQKIERLITLSDVVIAANDSLEVFAKRSGASKVMVIPTVVDWQRFASLPSVSQPNEIPVVGWIGTPMTSSYLDQLKPLLKKLVTAGEIRFISIGADISDQEQEFEAHPWSETSEPEQLFGLDIGIMPLPNDQWAQGKSGFKIIQYMAAGKPVVASPVGANCQIIDEGQTGFFATSVEDWERAILKLVRSRELRVQMGVAAREKARQKYSIKAVSEQLAEAFRN